MRHGFTGPVYATSPTADMAGVSLLDAAHIQEEDADYRNRKRLSRHKKALPLFTTADAEEALRLMKPIPFGKFIDINDEISFRMNVAGHVLGAAGVLCRLRDNGNRSDVFFSGDVGRYGNPLTKDPDPPPECDYLVCESTYGGRIHEPEDPRAVFIELINKIFKQKSVLLIPAFAVSRTQQITYLLQELIRHELIPEIDIHIDSPMAISATEIYCKYASLHEVDLESLGGPGCVLEGKNVHLCRKRKDSKLLNKLKGPAVIMSSSGMLTGGRIMHHLMNRLKDPTTTIALAGFMAEGTLGRRLAEGAQEVRIHKQMFEVKAEIVSMHGLSGHADFYELLHWLEPMERAPRKVFLTHGEETQSLAMARHLQRERDWETYIPALDEIVELQ